MANTKVTKSLNGEAESVNESDTDIDLDQLLLRTS